jgi:hypothetical protein
MLPPFTFFEDYTMFISQYVTPPTTLFSRPGLGLSNMAPTIMLLGSGYSNLKKNGLKGYLGN